MLFPLPEQTVTLSPLVVDYDDRDLVTTAPDAARYVIPAAKVSNKTYWTTLQRDLTDHLVATEHLEVLQNPDLKVFSRMGETPDEFTARCTESAMGEADKKAVPLQRKYETKMRTLQTRLDTATNQAQQAAAARNTGLMDSAASVLGGFLGGRKSVSSISAAARRAQTADARAKTPAGKVGDLQMQLQDLETDLTNELSDLKSDWEMKAANIEPVPVELKKTNVRITELRLVWVPVA